MTAILTLGPREAKLHLILAHGAGAPMTSPFMEAMCLALAEDGVASTRFEFAYMAGRRNDGVKRPPPSMDILTEEFRAVVAAHPCAPDQRLFIGGKSMGGRVASLIADDFHAAGAIAGLVCLGYPFHPPRKPGQLRTAHLAALRCPTLIVQGTRDPLGTEPQVATYPLSPAIALEWLADADHDFKPRKSSGHTQASHIATAATAIARFVTLP